MTLSTSPRSRRVHYEAVPEDLAAAFTFREFDSSSFPFNWHYHPEVELSLVLRGRGKRFVGDSVEEFSDGDLCLIGSNTPHSWVSAEDAEPGVRSLVVHFRPECWGEAFWKVPELRAIGQLLREAKAGLALRGSARNEMAQLFHVLEQQPRGSLQRFETFLEMLHCFSAARDVKRLSACEPDLPPRNGANGKLGRILGYIHAHLGPELTQCEVAKAAGLSPAAFSQFFRRSLGTSYVAYVNELKIRHACRALLDTDCPITQVAFEAGFNNLSHFNAQFQRFRHVSPRVFRRQARSAENPTPPLPDRGSLMKLSNCDLTVHGKGTRLDGVRAGSEEPRPWLRRYAVCPALERYGILHTGLVEAHAPYQIVRTHQSTSYFLACVSGRGRVVVDGQWRVIRPGLACLLPAHVHNTFEALPGDVWRFAYVCYKHEAEGEPQSSPSAPVITAFDPEPLRLAVEGLAAECRGEGRSTQLNQWLDLLQGYVGTFTTRSAPESLLRALWQRVTLRLHEPWRAEVLAREAGCSWENLRRLCLRELGRSPLQQLTHLRMRRAAELLTTTDLPLRAVARAVGYSNPLGFSNGFKAVLGCRPSEYRPRPSVGKPPQ